MWNKNYQGITSGASIKKNHLKDTKWKVVASSNQKKT